MIVRACGHLFDHQIRYPAWEPKQAVLQRWVEELGVGGVILLGGSAAEIAWRSQQLQAWAKVPLLISADVEEGVGQRFAGATWFPPPMALSALADRDPNIAADYARRMGETTAQEALAIGLNWILAPVVDVNNNPANPVINVRAFGEEPQRVSHLVTAFLQGTQAFPVLTAAKHFPGHGDTAVDSHLDLPILPHTPERLAKIELPPFQQAIAAGVDAVMSAHLLIPAWDPDLPATLSARVLTQKLRHQLGFTGLIVTDALVMGAIADRYGADQAAVLAIAAGADVLMMPANPEGAIQAICAAVEAGDLNREQIQASVQRIWKAKQKILSGIPEDANTSESALPPLLTQLSLPAATATVLDVLKATQVVVHPAPTRFQPAAEGHNLIIVDHAIACDFLYPDAPAIALPRDRGWVPQVVDNWTPNLPKLQTQLEPDQRPTLLQIFLRGNPFRGRAGLSEAAQSWFNFLLETDQLCALMIYGSPYLRDQFQNQVPPNVPWGFTYGQMPAAQTVLLTALFQQ